MVQINDLINASFELIGAITAWLNVIMYAKHRQVKGVLWHMTFFYCLWGIWNFKFYTDLHQWFSFYAGLVLTSGNLIWLAWVIKDKFRNHL